MSVKLKGLGPVKLGPVKKQLDFDRLTYQYYIWFAGSPILIAEEYFYV